MISKNNKAASRIVIGLLALAVSVAVGVYFYGPQTVASASDISIPTTQAAGTKLVEKMEVPPTDHPDRLSATQNDITVEVTSAQVIATGLEVGICYIALDTWIMESGVPCQGISSMANTKFFPTKFNF